MMWLVDGIKSEECLIGLNGDLEMVWVEFVWFVYIYKFMLFYIFVYKKVCIVY